MIKEEGKILLRLGKLPFILKMLCVDGTIIQNIQCDLDYRNPNLNTLEVLENQYIDNDIKPSLGAIQRIKETLK